MAANGETANKRTLSWLLVVVIMISVSAVLQTIALTTQNWLRFTCEHRNATSNMTTSSHVNVGLWGSNCDVRTSRADMCVTISFANNSTNSSTGKMDHRHHDDVIKWKHFPCYWPFVRGIHRSPVNSPHKSQWRGALMFPLIWAWTNRWANNGNAGDLRHHRAHYDVIVMPWQGQFMMRS